MAIEFRGDPAAYMKPKYDKGGQLSHLVYEPFKMVTDNKNIDKTALKQEGLEIKMGHEENYTTFSTRPKVFYGKYQYAISCAGPRQQVRGRQRNPSEVCHHKQ